MADELGLVVIAVRIARATVKATGDRIAQLQAAETSPRRRMVLEECAKDYALTVRRLGRAVRDFAAGGDEGRLTEAATLLEQ
uniref:Pectinesterase inhibitor domain-containing protein n=2 Tax=Aegilops tauschii TaxID=37682 RepID=N1QWU7_AEGTA